jgi:hypothetical protein
MVEWTAAKHECPGFRRLRADQLKLKEVVRAIVLGKPGLCAIEPVKS